MPARTLEHVAITPCWRTFIGALHGALSAIDPAGRDLAEIAGRTGFAFRINVHNDVCASGPTAFPSSEIIRRAFDQVGWDFDRFVAGSSDNTFPLVEKRAVEAVENGISRGTPSIVWGVGVPEFCLITGFDSDARRFKVSTVVGADIDANGLPYGDLGLGPVPFLEVIVPLEKTSIDESRVAVEALKIAVGHALGAEPHYAGYATGLAAYRLWIEALREGRAEVFGAAYNVQVYAESRTFAKEYLADLVTRGVAGSSAALAAAAESFERVADNFAGLAELFPFKPDLPRDEIVPAEKAGEAVALLERALFWEADAIKKLQTALKEIAQ
jgi:hypothetical protein